MSENPQEKGPKPPLDENLQAPPGIEAEMDIQPDYGEQSYKGSGKLQGRKAIITGGDSGIGRAVALAFAREGADVAIAYLNEKVDAEETRRIVEDADRKCLLIEGDIGDEAHCQSITLLSRCRTKALKIYRRKKLRRLSARISFRCST
jgi:hypothetical protein